MSPPRPRCCLNVGVTGHRANRLGQGELDRATPLLEHLLRVLSDKTLRLQAQERDCFDPAAPEFRVLSGLAEGSDRHVATIAVRQGYALHALLPFQRGEYAADFESADSRAHYDELLAGAQRVFELPGERDAAERAYELAGRALVSHADLMIALWDGQEARGPGGTAAVIEMALRRGLPVIHLQPGAGSQARILWTGYDPLPVERDSIDEYPWVACDDAALGTLTARMLAPHIDAVERGCLAYYFREDERRNRTRIEYPLLLALTGVRRFSVSSFRTQSYVGASADAWAAWRARLSTLGGGPAAASAELELAYAWSDNLANHFAQTFRSGHLLNFVLAAIAVMLALAGLLWPAAKLGLIVSELAIISMVVLNTSVGRSRQWHRRWLDYRYLAECLRPMRSLKLFGLARAAQRRSTRGTHPGRWPDWYAEALWRQMGCPSGCADARYRERLNELVVAEELQPQIDYHRATAKRMHHLEHRLHGVGNALFAATITACATFVAGYFIAHDWVVLRATAFTAITAALPALGGAIYGIRVHGDFGGSANRSLQTAAELERLARAMSASPAPGFTQAAALAESAARRMLSDLDEWQLTYRQRGLDIPA